ncbi:hypothetical protein ACF0H5_006400 [Mactra antiquata]
MGDTTLTILHFNDVYNVEPQKLEPAGGAARMASYVKSLKAENPLVLFSGDALNPSLMSIFLKGDQMIPCLNSIGVHCAVYGNHDFDFGVDHLEDFAEATNFPWLLSNITDKLNNEPLANGKIKHMIDWHGTKVGLMGLVEEEWIDTLSTIDPEDIIFEDFVEVGNKLATELKEEGADIVIALTHMRWPNDRKVAEMIPGVDIVLGGHDHDFNIEKVNGKYVVKSGTDFRNISKIVIQRTKDGLDIDIKCIDLDSSYPEDEELKKEIHKLSADIDSRMGEHLGSMGVSMDGRFASIRTMETNLGNFMTDIVLEAVPADMCLMNSGTFRSDRIHSKGEFVLRDLLTILPLVDPLVVIEITGKGVIEALENSVSQYPKLEGRFPQVSGVKFVFDPSKPSGHRIEAGLVQIQDEYVVMDKKYRLCTKEYIASGKDGYDVFKDCPVVVCSEQCPTFSTAVRNHFHSVKIIKNETPCRSGHRQSLCSIARRTLLIQQTVKRFMSLTKSRSSSESSSSHECTPPPSLTNTHSQTDANIHGSPKKKQKVDQPDGKTVVKDTTDSSSGNEENMNCTSRRDSMTDEARIAQLAKATEAFVTPLQGKKLSHAFVRQMSIELEETDKTHLCPKVEGRIVRVDDKKRLALLAEKLSAGSLTHNVVKDVIKETTDNDKVTATS